MKTGAFTTWLIGTGKMTVITCRRVEREYRQKRFGEGEIRRRQTDDNGDDNGCLGGGGFLFSSRSKSKHLLNNVLFWWDFE